jgi:hypothetical protein
MRSRSYRPRRYSLTQLSLIWICGMVVVLGLSASAGHAFQENLATFKDSQAAPPGQTNGGDPDGIGLGTTLPPPEGPPFAPGPENSNEGRLLGPQWLRLWIMQVLFDIAI